MAMRYANESDVLSQLHLDPGTPDDVAAIDRARRIELGVAAAIDSKLGRTFGVPVEETRTVRAPGVSDLLVLPMAVRSVSAVRIGSALLGSEEYVLAFHAHEGYLGIRLTAYAAYWYGDVAISGVWADAAIAGDIPHDIREAATFITVDEYRTRNASPAGEIVRFGTRIGQAQNAIRDELRISTDRLTIQGAGFAQGPAPVRTGHLRRSIAHKPAVSAGGTVTGSYGTATPYARIVEEGRGAITARGKALRFTIGGQVLYRKSVGPAAPRPFMRPSVERLRPLVGREYRAGLQRALARIGAG